MGVFDNPTVKGGRFMSAADVKSGETRFVIGKLGIESFPDGNRIVLDGHAHGPTGKPRAISLVLSPRNGNFVRSALAGRGVAEEALIGATLSLGTQAVMFKGEMRDSITLSGIEWPAAKATGQ